jgi:hypothetical protein
MPCPGRSIMQGTGAVSSAGLCSALPVSVSHHSRVPRGCNGLLTGPFTCIPIFSSSFSTCSYGEFFKYKLTVSFLSA